MPVIYSISKSLFDVITATLTNISTHAQFIFLKRHLKH